MEPLMPFKYVIISPEDTSMKEGCIISEFNQCGLFLCQKGQAEILLGGNHIRLTKGIFSYILQPTFYRYAKEAQTWKES